MKLSEASSNEVYCIINVEGTYEEINKLYEVGLRKGRKVRMICKAPFLDPAVVEIATYRIILSMYLLNLIEVEVIH